MTNHVHTERWDWLRPEQHPDRPWWSLAGGSGGQRVISRKSYMASATRVWKRIDGMTAMDPSEFEAIDRAHPIPAPDPEVGQAWEDVTVAGDSVFEARYTIATVRVLNGSPSRFAFAGCESYDASSAILLRMRLLRGPATWTREDGSKFGGPNCQWESMGGEG